MIKPNIYEFFTSIVAFILVFMAALLSATFLIILFLVTFEYVLLPITKLIGGGL